jgi:flavin-dependent dehydrogenase
VGAARCAQGQLTDEHAALSGRFTPGVRQPVAMLPSGRRLLGMADAVVLNDPITGQGSNSAIKCCQIYLDAILRQGDGPFRSTGRRTRFSVIGNTPSMLFNGLTPCSYHLPHIF